MILASPPKCDARRRLFLAEGFACHTQMDRRHPVGIVGYRDTVERRCWICEEGRGEGAGRCPATCPYRRSIPARSAGGWNPPRGQFRSTRYRPVSATADAPVSSFQRMVARLSFVLDQFAHCVFPPHQFFVTRTPNRRGSVRNTLVVKPLSSLFRNVPVMAVVSKTFFR